MPSDDWFDENGKEVFLPDKLRIKPYETSVDFTFKGKKGEEGTKIKAFLDSDSTGVMVPESLVVFSFDV